VHEYLVRSAAAGVSWPLPEGVSEPELEASCLESTGSNESGGGAGPSGTKKRFDEQLRQHRHLTLRLLWQEYWQTQPEGYGSS
jgi:hypothetical protein